MASKPTPFEIDVPEHVLTDLQQRLAGTRWPNEPEAAGWRYGANLAYMHDVLVHWRDRYDWRAAEARINRWPNYKADVDGLSIHFLMEPGSGDHPLPLIITHGWPGSFVEFLDVIEPLAHPERFGADIRDAFTVVTPSMPGYGFSSPPPAPITPRDIAGLWHALMRDVLSFDRFVAQGGDWGAPVTSWLAVDHPEDLAAIHLNMLGLRPHVGEGSPPLTAEEQQWLDMAQKRRGRESAYQQIQGTKPQTLAYGLTDSPIGLAAWVLEKFHGWTVPGSDGPPPFDLDRLLTNVMLYWLGGINSANWLYQSMLQGTALSAPPGLRVEVPAGIMLCPNDISPPAPRSWAERVYDVKRWRVNDSGGHFLAFENGPQLVEELRSFFRDYR